MRSTFSRFFPFIFPLYQLPLYSRIPPHFHLQFPHIFDMVVKELTAKFPRDQKALFHNFFLRQGLHRAAAGAGLPAAQLIQLAALWSIWPHC